MLPKLHPKDFHTTSSKYPSHILQLSLKYPSIFLTIEMLSTRIKYLTHNGDVSDDIDTAANMKYL